MAPVDVPRKIFIPGVSPGRNFMSSLMQPGVAPKKA